MNLDIASGPTSSFQTHETCLGLFWYSKIYYVNGYIKKCTIIINKVPKSVKDYVKKYIARIPKKILAYLKTRNF